MKCVECKKEAEYILHGNSLCEEHYNIMIPAIKQLGELNKLMLKEIKEDFSQKSSKAK